MEQTILHLLDLVLTPFRFPLFGLLGLLVLMSLVFGSYVLIKKKYTTITQELDAAILVIDEIQDSEKFTSQFHIINGKLKTNNLVKRNWEEFHKTLIPPLDHIDEPEYKVYRATKRTWDYFDLDHVSSEIKPIVKSETLIGIGLVLTFFGLVAALIHAGLNIKTDADPKTVMVAIQELLGTAGAKFFSSIGGVGGAIIQAGIIYIYQKRIEQKLFKFNDKLESLLPFASQERILADQYSHSIRQTLRLEQMGTEIALALGEKIPAAMNQIPVQMKDALTGVMGPVAEKLENMTDSLSRSSSDALGQMVKEFSQQIQGAGEQTMSQVVTQLDSLSNALNTTVGTLGQSNMELRSGLQDVMQALNDTTKKFDSSVQASADAAASQLNSTSSSLMDGLTNILKELQVQQSSSTSAIQSLVDRLDGAANNAAQSLKASSDSASAQVAEGITEAMRAVLQQAESATKDVSDSVKNGIGDLVNSISKMNLEIERNSQNIQQVNSKLIDTAGAIGGAAEGIRASTQPLSQVTIQLTTAADSIRKGVSDTYGQIESLVKSTENASQNISNAITTLLSTWEEQSSHLQGADSALEDAFKQVTSNLERSLDILSKFMNSLDGVMSKSLNSLSAIAAELTEAVEDTKKIK